MRKRNYEIIKVILILVIILSILETLFLIIKTDLLRIILSIIVYLSLIAIIVMFLIAKKDLKNIIFDKEVNPYIIRLVEDDDYQKIRILLNSEPLENSLEEIKRLNEYQKITIDFTRIDYHYIVIKNENAICVFQSIIDDKKVKIIFKNDFEEIDEIKKILNDISTEKNYSIEFGE